MADENGKVDEVSDVEIVENSGDLHELNQVALRTEARKHDQVKAIKDRIGKSIDQAFGYPSPRRGA